MKLHNNYSLQEPRAVLTLRVLSVCWTGPWETHGLLSATPETPARANRTIIGLLGFMRIHSSSGTSFPFIYNCQICDPLHKLEIYKQPVKLGILPISLRCIPCKGSRFPPTLPRPAVAVLPFNLPYCQTTTEKGQMEVWPKIHPGVLSKTLL